MTHRTVRTVAQFLCLLAAGVFCPTALTAQGWLTQTYTVSARLVAEAESLKFPERRDLVLVVPEEIPLPEVCVDARSSALDESWRTRVRVVINPADAGGEARAIQQVEFEWRNSDPPLNASRCQPVQPLLAGDVVEFRFHFFDRPRIEVTRSGRRIESLPSLRVTGRLRHDPFSG